MALTDRFAEVPKIKALSADNTLDLLPVTPAGGYIKLLNLVAAHTWSSPDAMCPGCTGDWLHTGDQGFLDEDGFVTLTGRIKELINRGGEKISPIEVLLSAPSWSFECILS